MFSLEMFNFLSLCLFSFFFNDTATTEIYTLSLHDALPICAVGERLAVTGNACHVGIDHHRISEDRSEDHTSELQSRGHLVCRLLLEKKKKKKKKHKNQKKTRKQPSKKRPGDRT